MSCTFYSLYDPYSGITKIGITSRSVESRLRTFRAAAVSSPLRRFVPYIAGEVVFDTEDLARGFESRFAYHNILNWVRVYGREFFWTGGPVGSGVFRSLLDRDSVPPGRPPGEVAAIKAYNEVRRGGCVVAEVPELYDISLTTFREHAARLGWDLSERAE